MDGRYRCAKCDNTEFEAGELRAAGGFWTKIFNIDSRRFTTVSCTRCQYTEIYRGASSRLGHVLDFLTN